MNACVRLNEACIFNKSRYIFLIILPEFTFFRKINEAVFEQMKILWHTTNIYLHPKLYEYVEKLVKKLPGDLKVGVVFI